MRYCMVLLAVCAAGGVGADSGWALRGFSDRRFDSQYAATNLAHQTAFALPGYPVKPEVRGKPPCDWSFALRGKVTAPVGTLFRVRETAGNGAAYQLDAKRLADGVALTVLARPKYGWPRPGCGCTGGNFALEWRKPGMGDYAPVPAEAVSHTEGDLTSPIYGFDREFTQADAFVQNPVHRSFRIRVTESGLYRIAVFSRAAHEQFKAYLDGREILHQRQRDLTSGFTRDFFGRYVHVTWLEKGEHVLEAFVPGCGWYFEDHWDDYNWKDGNLRLGYSRLTGGDPRSEAGFWFEDRDSLVFAGGRETLKLRAQSTGRAGVYTMEVTPPDALTNVVWSQKLSVADKPAYFEYPCAEQGVYEYVVRDPAGTVVEGPWQFVVVDVVHKPLPPVVGTKEPEGVVVDALSCDEPPGGRHDFRDNGTSAVVTNADGLAYRLVGPKGIRIADHRFSHDWYAFTVKARHPGRTHVLRCRVPNDERRFITVYAVDRLTGHYSGWSIECGLGAACGKTSELSFALWPNQPEVDVMVINSTGNHGDCSNRRSAVCSMELVEYPGGLPCLPAAVGRNIEFGWDGEQVDLGPNERTMPPISVGHARDWRHLLCSWERFGELSGWRGDTLVFFPQWSYLMQTFRGPASRMIVQGDDPYARGKGYRHVDLFSRDIYALMLLVAERHNLRIGADMMLGWIRDPVLADWARAAGDVSLTNGMRLTVGPEGKPFKTMSGATFLNPAHPVARRVQVDFARGIGARYGKYPAFPGLFHRFWRAWPGSMEPTWYGANLGVDAWTKSRFAAEGGTAQTWEKWRTEKVLTLHEEKLAALREGAPTARLYAVANGSADHGETIWSRESGLDPAAFRGRRELGYLEEQVALGGRDVEINTLDPTNFFNFYRSYTKSPQGLCCNRSYKAHPYQLEDAARALAENRLERLVAGGQWCLPPTDRGLRAFVAEWRKSPDVSWTLFKAADGSEATVPVWYWTDGAKLVFRAVNRTDATQEVSVVFGSDTRRTLSLAPYMPHVETIEGCSRISSAEVLVRDDERTAALAEADRILGWEAFARDAVEVRHGAGSRYMEGGESLGFSDARTTYDQIAAPVRAARAKGDVHRLRGILAEMKRNHAWWFEAFGWPEGGGRLRPVGRASMSSMIRRHKKEAMWCLNREIGALARVPELSGSADEFFCVPRGRTAKFYIHGNRGGMRRLVMTGLFGGGYGDIRVTDAHGKALGVIPAGASKAPHYETRLLSVTIPCPMNGITVGLTADAPRGLALARLDAEEADEVRITKWQLNGRPVEVPDNPVIDLAKTVPGAVVSGNRSCAAELVAWVKPAPGANETWIRYANDYFGSIHLNGEPLVAEMNGPIGHMERLPVKFKSGWNEIRVKSLCGMATTWYFGLSVAVVPGYEFTNRNPFVPD